MGRIAGYRFGRVTVDGREVTRDVIVLPDRVVENWWRRDGHALAWVELEDVVDELPSRLVVGTGADQRMQPDKNSGIDRQRRGDGQPNERTEAQPAQDSRAEKT